MRLIPDWRNKKLRCHFCDETRSVKYAIKVFNPAIDNKPTEVCICNKCALLYNDEVIIIDEECLDCKRYYSGSCNGVEDRKREKITIENSCSGYLKREQEQIKE